MAGRKMMSELSRQKIKMTPEYTKKEMLERIEDSDKEELRKLTSTEAFEMGKVGDMSQYDLAGRKLALAFLKFARRHPSVDLQEFDNFHDFFAVLDPEARKAVDDIGPSGFQCAWAFVNVRWVLG